MIEKNSEIIKEDVLGDLISHDFSTSSQREFATKIVRPYSKENMNQTIKSIIEKATIEENIATNVSGVEDNG